MPSNQYETLMRHVYEHGTHKSDRTGTGTKSVFGYQMRFNLQEGFPLVTTKKLHLRSIIHELLWFLKGESNIKYLKDNGVSMNGRMRTATWVQSMACSGAVGQRPMVVTLTKFPMCSSRSKKTQTAAV